MTTPRTISVILPAYNEEDNIEAAVNDILSYLVRIAHEYEVIIVNDGSRDRTGEIADGLASQNPHVRVIHHNPNKGYGQALKSGFAAAQYRLLFFTDSDRQFDIRNLDDMLPLITDADIVIGYRLNRQDPPIRKILSLGYNILMKILFNLKARDIDCAFKLFRREVFDHICIESDRFFVNTEILVKARTQRFRIREVGVQHFPRTANLSSVGFKQIPLTIREVTRIWKSLHHEK